MEKGRVVVLDNGGATCKIGFGGEAEPVKVIPNFVAKAKGLKRPFVADLVDTCPDIKGLGVLRPVDRGYVVNWDLQRSIWDRAFSGILKVQPSSASLLVSEPLFSLPSIQRSMDELAFEHFGFRSYLRVPAPVLAYRYETSTLLDSPPPPMPSSLASSSAVSASSASAAASSAMALQAGCGLLVDAGFSFTHAVPIWNNKPLLHAVRRMNVGGKALTNVLKEVVSYRAWNMMDETLIMDHVKESMCLVSLFPTRHLPLARKRDTGNIFRVEYLLPDGVTLQRGQVKDPAAVLLAVKAQEALWEQHREEGEREEAVLRRGGGEGREVGRRKKGGDRHEGRKKSGSNERVGKREEGGEGEERGRKRGRRGGEGEREEESQEQEQGGGGGGGGGGEQDEEDDEDEEDEDWDERAGRGKPGATAGGGASAAAIPPPGDSGSARRMAGSRGTAGGGGGSASRDGGGGQQPELSLASERFMVPEGLFHPSDFGVNQAGLAETIVASVSAAPRVIHPLLFSNIVLVGGSCQFPFFKERLELELRPLVPDSLPIHISLSQSPVVSAWKGGSNLVRSGEFARRAVTKKQYEELGFERCAELMRHS
ncbi:hypothetical protein CLOP_g18315 [Closterium sp. NIES-67]|nr:hypothetical protein CLOP_g18315 [Closterium sp. NIES-67]